MINRILDRISFATAFFVVVLLPLFFIPFSKVPIETSKTLIVVLGVLIGLISWIVARFLDRKIIFSRSVILYAILGIVFSTLLSSLFSSSISASLFGVMLDIGTFYFTLVCFLLTLVVLFSINDKVKARILFAGFLIASLVLVVFQLVHLFIPEFLSFGVLPRNVNNLLGSWSALGLLSGMLVVLSLVLLEFFDLFKPQRVFLFTLLALSLVLAFLVNFVLVWILVGVFSLGIFILKIIKSESKSIPILPILLVVLSLILFVLTERTANFLSSRWEISSPEVSPNLKTTSQIAWESIKNDPVFGVGPNKFKEIWAMHKPSSVNNTVFWNTDFDFGFGLIPTLAITTGILGILSWLIFLFYVFRSSVKKVADVLKTNTASESSIFIIATLYLIIAGIFHPIGLVLFFLAFAFLGVFVGLESFGKNGSFSFTLSDEPKTRFIVFGVLSLVMVVSIFASFKFLEKFISVSHFGKSIYALLGRNLPQAESEIIKAINLNQNDFYLRTYSQIYIAKLNEKLSQNNNPDANAKSQMQNSLDRAVTAADLASQYDKNNYVNFRSLALVYDSLSQIGVAGAVDKSIESYQKAISLNPLNPGLKVSIARAYLSKRDIANAKLYAEQAVALKSNYVEGLVLLSQILDREGNTERALNYAEQALSVAPNDKALIDYVNSLK